LVNSLTKFGTWDPSLRSTFILVIEYIYVNTNTKELIQEPLNNIEVGLSLAMKANSYL
jgi:hypothetical protein